MRGQNIWGSHRSCQAPTDRVESKWIFSTQNNRRKLGQDIREYVQSNPPNCTVQMIRFSNISRTQTPNAWERDRLVDKKAGGEEQSGTWQCRRESWSIPGWDFLQMELVKEQEEDGDGVR